MPISGPSPTRTALTNQLRLDLAGCDNESVKPTLVAATPMAAVLVWLAAIMIEPGRLNPTSVLLIGFGWLLLATIGTVGLVLVGGRWALNTLLVVLGTTFWAAGVSPLNAWSVTGLGISAVALTLLLSPQQRRLVRKLPSAGGPPPRSVFVTLAALGYPLALGLTPAEADSWVLAMAACGPLAALLYSRTVPGGLAAMRFGLMGATLATALWMPLPHAITAVVLSLAITAVAWSTDVAIAFRPLIEKGSTYAIPPELAPKEILDSAGIDEKGQPL